jgi:phosphate transport system substrate-binding protein
MKSQKDYPATKLIIACLFALLLCPLAHAAESITVAGTGDSQHLLRQLVLEFQKTRPDSQVLIPNSVGSGGGIKLLVAGRTDLARIARPLKPKEQAEGLTARIFAYSPIVFVANLPEACIDNMSDDNFLAMLRGEISNWSQLGDCPDHKIYIANREEGDSSKTVLEQEIPEINNIPNPVGRTIYSTPEAFTTLNQYPFSFGYLPKAQIQKSGLTILKHNGIEASKKNIQDGSYKLVVPLGIVWREQPTGLTKEFLDYLFSPEAKQLMEKLHAVPVK